MAPRKYDLPAMRDFVAFLDESIEAVERARDDARRVADTIGAHFTGETADAFAEAHRRWQDDWPRHLDRLRAFRDRVDTAQSNYTRAEQANRLMFPGTA